MGWVGHGGLQSPALLQGAWVSESNLTIVLCESTVAGDTLRSGVCLYDLLRDPKFCPSADPWGADSALGVAGRGRGRRSRKAPPPGCVQLGRLLKDRAGLPERVGPWVRSKGRRCSA